jgi:hypothetical protein
MSGGDDVMPTVTAVVLTASRIGVRYAYRQMISAHLSVAGFM